jgi:non-ribosomal peptide synthetase component E (peptide arylation enzyme)
MAGTKKDAAYYARDKARQAAVDKRGYYSKGDQENIRRTGNEQDKRRMAKSPRKRSSK